MENFYGALIILGTNEKAVERNFDGEKRTKEQMLEFIRDKYEHQKRIIKNSRDIAQTKGEQNRLRELQKDEEKLETAYEIIKCYISQEKDGVLANSSNSQENRDEQTVARRENDDKRVDFKARMAVEEPQLSRKNKESNREDQLVIQIKSPYEILKFMEETLKDKTPEQKDKALKTRKEQLINAALINLKKATNFNERMKIELRIRQIEVAYEAVATEEKRKKNEEEQQTNHPINLYDKTESEEKGEQGEKII